MIHSRAEEREPRTKEASDKGVGGDGTVRVEQVHIDDILKPLDEDNEHGTTHRDSANNLCRPRRTRVASPSEPEQAAGENDSADDHRRKTALRDDLAGCTGGLASEDGEGVSYGGAEAKGDADEEGEEDEGSLTGGPMAVFGEGDREAFEEEEEHAIEETLVEGY